MVVCRVGSSTRPSVLSPRREEGFLAGLAPIPQQQALHPASGASTQRPSSRLETVQRREKEGGGREDDAILSDPHQGPLLFPSGYAVHPICFFVFPCCCGARVVRRARRMSEPNTTHARPHTSTASLTRAGRTGLPGR